MDTDTPDDTSDVSQITQKQICVIFLCVLTFSLVVGFIPMARFGFVLRDEVGLWGDSFGFVNSLLSGLAFAGVIITLIMQKTELTLQRGELRLQREEMRQSRHQYERMALAQEQSEENMMITSYVTLAQAMYDLNRMRREMPSIDDDATTDEIRSAGYIEFLWRSLDDLHPRLIKQLNLVFPERQTQRPHVMLFQFLASSIGELEDICSQYSDSSYPAHLQKTADLIQYIHAGLDEFVDVNDYTNMAVMLMDLAGDAHELRDFVGDKFSHHRVKEFWQRAGKYQTKLESMLVKAVRKEA